MTAASEGNPVSLSIDDFERDDIIAAIRQVFSSGNQLDRDTAIREVSHTLGFQRTGTRIAQSIDSALIAAVKRSVIQNQRGLLSIACRNIGDYSRDQLIEALLGARGYTWRDREEAMRAAARYLGFRRTGSAIRKAFKSAINGAIRRGLLERNGPMIRKAR